MTSTADIADLPPGVTVVRRIVWDDLPTPIVIIELSDGTVTVNGSPVVGRPEFDGLPPPEQRVR